MEGQISNGLFVKDAYYISEQSLGQLAGEYGKACKKFYQQVKDQYVGELSKKQKLWLHKIEKQVTKDEWR